jgi:hypothetical protein
MQARWQKIDDWYHSVMGNAFLSVLQHTFSQKFNTAPDAVVVQVGASYTSIISNFKAQHKIMLDDSPSGTCGVPAVIADVNMLPLQPNSTDVIVLMHALEVCEKRIDVLQRCFDALAPEGILINVSFNPLSMYGMRRLFGSSCGLPQSLRLVSAMQLSNWLKDLRFCDISSLSCGFSWPTNNKFISQKMLWMEKVGHVLYPGCGHYIISTARKRVTDKVSAQSWADKIVYNTGTVDVASRSLIDDKRSS